MQLRDDLSFSALQDFGRNAFISRCFARCKGVESRVWIIVKLYQHRKALDGT